MALSPFDGPPAREFPPSLRTLTDLGHSLRQARQSGGLSLADAAARTGLETDELAALESGDPGRMPDRIGTLRALGTYAESLGLRGADYVAAMVALWPTVGPGRHDVALPPVVSVSTGVAGGTWPSDVTGVTDSTITGVVASVGVGDTGRVPIVNTGEVRLVRPTTPLLLKVTVVVVAVLVVLSGLALAEHSHVSSWYHRAGSVATRVYRAAGFGSKPATHRAAAHPAPPLPKVTYATDAATRSVVVNVSASTFTVKMVAYKSPVWIKVTPLFHPRPTFEQVLPAGQTHTFGVNSSVTIVTASSSARAYLYQGKRYIGFYIPNLPFTMTFNAVKAG
jgi:hypothetical protein